MSAGYNQVRSYPKKRRDNKSKFQKKVKPQYFTYQEALAQQKRNNPEAFPKTKKMTFEERSIEGEKILSKQRAFSYVEKLENQKKIESFSKSKTRKIN